METNTVTQLAVWVIIVSNTFAIDQITVVSLACTAFEIVQNKTSHLWVDMLNVYFQW